MRTADAARDRTAYEDTLSGTCGQGVRWRFRRGTGTLSVTGTGAMTDYGAGNPAPWQEARLEVRTIAVRDGVTAVGTRAFAGCRNLHTVSFPAGLARIGRDAFLACGTPAQVTFAGELPEIAPGNGALADGFCGRAGGPAGEGTAWRFIPSSGLLEISGEGDMADYMPDCTPWEDFRHWVRLVRIGPGVGRIGRFSFRGCTRLARAELGSAAHIGAAAFSGCTALHEIVWPDAPCTVGDWAFRGCTALEEAVFSAAPRTLGAGVFAGCTALEKAVFPAGTLRIGTHVFSGCTALRQLSLPAGLREIGPFAFSGCTALKHFAYGGRDWREIRIGPGNGILRDAAYTWIRLPYNGTCGEHAAWQFSQFTGVLTITGEGAMTDWGWDDEVPWHPFRGRITYAELSPGITAVGAWAFAGCSSLQKIIVPATVGRIGEMAFSGCDALEEAEFRGAGGLRRAIEIGQGNDAIAAAAVIFRVK